MENATFDSLTFGLTLAPVIREDFLKRTIRQLTEAVARLLGLARAGRNELAEQQLSQLYLDHLGMPREAVALLSPESLVLVLGTRAPIAAELLRAEAELRLTQGFTGDVRELLARAERLGEQ
jgi:hypothetical protein